jgi:hypothetical protein
LPVEGVLPVGGLPVGDILPAGEFALFPFAAGAGRFEVPFAAGRLLVEGSAGRFMFPFAG